VLTKLNRESVLFIYHTVTAILVVLCLVKLLIVLV